MIRIFKRLGINTQLSVLLGAVVAAAVVALSQVVNDINVAQAYRSGSAYADVAEAIGVWSSRPRGIWVKTDAQSSYEVGVALDRYVVPRPVPSAFEVSAVDGVSPVTIYHWKNPALIQREISDVLHQANTPIRFKMISDNPLNRDNLAKRFELSALEVVRAKLAASGLKSENLTTENVNQILQFARSTDYYEIQGEKLLYARPIVATKACLRCHESEGSAPEAVRTSYPGNQGYGYKEGGIIGVVSVEVMMQRSAIEIFSQMSIHAWSAIALFFLLVCCVLAFMRYGVIRPVALLTLYAESIKRQDNIEPLEFDSEERTSSNQIHRLSASIKALFEALRHYRNRFGSGH